ncbi:PIR Superfamily Protein [Plasmodium ovale wallikeri]|uniref:PIR Superfamily Protein n=1 Tax=Plasmodium ovale wallikeri TaxID=864142 RepID=A0A1A9AM74_PLAOA|nr:PIR Superfamily Protein [Plasmodium ovale wallikeri]
MEHPDPFFDNWEFDLLMKIPLYYIYKDFNNYYSYYSSSNNIDKNELALFSECTKEINPGCNAINNALKNLKNDLVKYDLFDTNKHCEYLSYFLYDKLKKITGINFDQLYEEINDNMPIYDLNTETCHIKEFHKYKDNFRNKKYLYFYSEMLHWIKEKYKEYFYLENDFCNKCIQDSVTFYNEEIKSKYCEKKDSYETELQSFIRNFNETKEFLEGNGIQIIPPIKKLLTEPTCPAETRNALDTESSGHSHSTPQINPIPEDSDPEIPPIGNPNNGADTTAGIVLGTFSGISLLYFIFHKFTPFGSLISQKLGSTKKHFNLGEKSEELSLDAYDNDDASLFNNEYHIQY